MPVRCSLLLTLSCGIGFLACGPRAESPRPTAIAPELFENLDAGALTQLGAPRARIEALADRASAEAAEWAAAWSGLAMQAHALERHPLARIAYRNAALFDPRDGRWPYLEGQAALAESDLQGALDAFERALATDDPGARALIGRAQVLWKLGRLDEAASAIDLALQTVPTSAAALLSGAQIAADRGDDSFAIARYEELLRLQPRASRIQAPLSLLYRRNGRIADADEAYAKRGENAVAVSDPALAEVQSLAHHDRAQAARAGLAFQRGNPQEAEALLREAVARAPEVASHHLDLSAVLIATNRFDEAAGEIDRALALDPAVGRAWFALGVVKNRRQDIAGAITAYRTALELDPEDRGARQNLANTLLRAGRTSAALVEFHTILEQEPTHVAARLGVAASLFAAGRQVEARSSLEKGFHPQTAAPAISMALVRILAAAGSREARDGGRALEIAHGLPGLDSSPLAIESLAMAQAETGDTTAAIATQERGLALARRATPAPAIDLISRMELNLLRYRRGKPCRDPAFY